MGRLSTTECTYLPTSHALTSLGMPVGPITWCLIVWDPMA